MLSVGFVSGLDYRDPMFDPHVTFQHFKRHPLVAALLDGGQMVRYGAKALPEGGWHTIPRVYADGVLIAGDAGGFLNSMRLKGIHLAMRTGMLAAETAFDAVRAGDASAARLQRLRRRRSTRARCGASCIRSATSIRASATACSPGVAYSGLSLRDRRLVVPRSDAGARRLRADAEARRLLPRRPSRSGRAA